MKAFTTPKPQISFRRESAQERQDRNAGKGPQIFLKWFLIVLMFCIAVMAASAQEYIGSQVDMLKVRADSVNYTAKGIGVISLGEQTNEFNVGVFLYPIVTSPKENDSINKINRLYYLNFKAVFPVSPGALDNMEREKRSFTVLGEITLNGVSKSLEINIELNKPITQESKTTSPDVQSVYPAHISFAIEINPAEFNMDNETIKFTQVMMIQVHYGTINRIKS